MQTPVNNLLVNLAAADMIVGIFFGIQYIITPLLNHPDGLTGDILCKLVTGGVLGWVGGSIIRLFPGCHSNRALLCCHVSFQSKTKVDKKESCTIRRLELDSCSFVDWHRLFHHGFRQISKQLRTQLAQQDLCQYLHCWVVCGGWVFTTWYYELTIFPCSTPTMVYEPITPAAG